MKRSARELIRIRLIADVNRVEELAGQLVETLERNRCEVLEWTNPYPCRSPEETKARVYISAVQKNQREE